MNPKLAKLSDLKARDLLNMSETTHDAALLRLLDASSATGEQLAGRPLRRAVVTEYPRDTPAMRQIIRLERYPIESITSVKQAYEASTDAQFDDLTALVENDDYVLDAERGKLERIASSWSTYRRHLQVAYVGGYADPQRVAIAITAGAWTAATKTLTKSGAFTSYTLVPGDVIVVTGGTGVIPGTYEIATRVGNDAITLSESIAASDAADVTTGYASLILPASDLQRGVLMQAVRLWRTGAFSGTPNVSAAGGSQSVDPGTDVAPELRAACMALRDLYA